MRYDPESYFGQMLDTLACSRYLKISKGRFDNPMQSTWEESERTIFNGLDLEGDGHFYILPLWTSASEILLLKKNYLWFLVWDQNYLHYIQSMSFVLGLVDQDAARGWASVWVSTYLFERLLTRSPEHAREYYFQIQQRMQELKPIEACESQPEFGQHALQQIHTCQRLFCLYHEISHLLHLARGGLREALGDPACQYLSDLEKIYVYQATGESNLDVAVAKLNSPFVCVPKYEFVRRVSAEGGEDLEEFSCDLWAIVKCVEFAAQCSDRERVFRQILQGLALLYAVTSSLRLGADWKLRRHVNRGDLSVRELMFENQMLGQETRFDFAMLVSRDAAKSQLGESDLSCDWVDGEILRAHSLYYDVGRLLASNLGGIATTPGISEPILTERTLVPSADETRRQWGWLNRAELEALLQS